MMPITISIIPNVRMAMFFRIYTKTVRGESGDQHYIHTIRAHGKFTNGIRPEAQPYKMIKYNW